MSVIMTKNEGVTILTMNSDPQSHLPPLCQIMKDLCCSPMCCSVSQHLRTVQRSCLSVLGTMQIMVGLLNIGLGVILQSVRANVFYALYYTGFPYWLGTLFIVFGISCILSERFASPCLVILNVILNLVGVVFALTAIVLYSLNATFIYRRISFYEYDWSHRYNGYHGYYGYRQTQSPHSMYMKKKYSDGEDLIVNLMRSINAVLIVLSVLELCVTISSVVLGSKAMRNPDNNTDRATKTQNSTIH